MVTILPRHPKAGYRSDAASCRARGCVHAACGSGPSSASLHPRGRGGAIPELSVYRSARPGSVCLVSVVLKPAEGLRVRRKAWGHMPSNRAASIWVRRFSVQPSQAASNLIGRVSWCHAVRLLITSWDTVSTGQILCTMTGQFLCCLQLLTTCLIARVDNATIVRIFKAYV